MTNTDSNNKYNSNFEQMFDMREREYGKIYSGRAKATMVSKIYNF